MKKFIYSLVTFSVLLGCLQAQVTPEIYSWILNKSGTTGFGGILTNVQNVQFSNNNVYISATCIPGYDIGPWAGNPNTAANQNFVFKITRTPVSNTLSLTNTPLGHIGLWSNGVSIFNAKDGMSYNNAGVWNRDALYFEGASFDSCLGHPAPNGEYHHHVNPRCLYNEADSLNHSPIIGFAFDGFPIYGAYGFANTNGTGGIKRMRSSYVLSTAVTRTNGPAVGGSFPAGCFVEDYNFNSGSGDLDVHNGRFCVTPDYPTGTYAYFVTINSALNPVYPYVIGSTYFGVVAPGNTGPGSGHNTISETVSSYDPTGIKYLDKEIEFDFFPNPTSNNLHVILNNNSLNNLEAAIFNSTGELIMRFEKLQPAVPLTVDLSEIPAGVYTFLINGGNHTKVRKLLVLR